MQRVKTVIGVPLLGYEWNLLICYMPQRTYGYGWTLAFYLATEKGSWHTRHRRNLRCLYTNIYVHTDTERKYINNILFHSCRLSINKCKWNMWALFKCFKALRIYVISKYKALKISLSVLCLDYLVDKPVNVLMLMGGLGSICCENTLGCFVQLPAYQGCMPRSSHLSYWLDPLFVIRLPMTVVRRKHRLLQTAEDIPDQVETCHTFSYQCKKPIFPRGSNPIFEVGPFLTSLTVV